MTLVKHLNLERCGGDVVVIVISGLRHLYRFPVVGTNGNTCEYLDDQ